MCSVLFYVSIFIFFIQEKEETKQSSVEEADKKDEKEDKAKEKKKKPKKTKIKSDSPEPACVDDEFKDTQISQVKYFRKGLYQIILLLHRLKGPNNLPQGGQKQVVGMLTEVKSSHPLTVQLI